MPDGGGLCTSLGPWRHRLRRYRLQGPTRRRGRQRCAYTVSARDCAACACDCTRLHLSNRVVVGSPAIGTSRLRSSPLWHRRLVVCKRTVPSVDRFIARQAMHSSRVGRCAWPALLGIAHRNVVSHTTTSHGSDSYILGQDVFADEVHRSWGGSTVPRFAACRWETSVCLSVSLSVCLGKN